MRRKFSGKWYGYYGAYQYKYAAGQAAKKIRRMGRLARVVRGKNNMWVVWEKAK